MPDIPLIYDDPRTILGISTNEADVGWVGNEGVTEIVAYKEMGQGSYVAFYAVKRGDEIWKRVPASMVMVRYGNPEEF